jgi:hypothetical protein
MQKVLNQSLFLVGTKVAPLVQPSPPPAWSVAVEQTPRFNLVSKLHVIVDVQRSSRMVQEIRFRHPRYPGSTAAYHN